MTRDNDPHDAHPAGKDIAPADRREPPLHLAILIGSTRAHRFGDTVAGWFTGRAEQRRDLVVDIIDLSEVNLPARLPSDDGPPVDAYLRRLASADAFVIITPEYNHSFPASLKQAIDVTGGQWKAKPLAFVSYGGLSGGLRAVEHLRPVFAEMHAVTVRDGVILPMAWRQFAPDGQLKDDAPNAAADRMLDQLAWWGQALRVARQASPYPF
jgi:NAD(P)H-dependent FMN reductase